MEILRTIILCLGLGLMTFQGISQISSAEDAYNLLDGFLMNPSTTSMVSFSDKLDAWNPGTTEGQMAKVVSYCNLGYQQRRRVLFFDAIRSYEKAKQLYQQHSLIGYDMIEFCYKPLGNLYTQTNALEEAEHIIKEYVLLAQQEKRTEDEASGLLNLSAVFHSKGNYQQAIQVLEQGMRLASNKEGFQINLATNYFSLGDVNTSEAMIRPLLEKDDCKILQLWAQIQLKKDAPENAIHSLERCWDLNQKNQIGSLRDMAKLSLAMAQTEWALGNTEKTKVYLYRLYKLIIPGFSENEEFPKTEQLFPENTLIDALDLHAKVLEKEEKPQWAYKAYVRAFQVEDLLDVPAGLQETKLLQQTRNKIRSEKCLELLFTLYKDQKNEAWLEKAFIIDQQSKHPVLRETRQWQESLLKKDDTLVQQLRDTKKELAVLSVQMEQMRESKILHPLPFKELQESYNSALLKQRSLYDLLNERYPENHISKTITVQEAIAYCQEQKQVMVNYFFGKDALYQFLITSNGVEWNRLTQSQRDVNDILQYINEFNNYFETPSSIANDPMGFTAASRRLYSALQLPVSEHMVVIPDGLLSFAPFSALITRETETTEFSEMPFLITESQITYALSVGDYMDSSPTKERPTLLGIFPVFANTSKALDFSLDEANSLEKYTQATLLLNDEATSNAFLTMSSDHDILHISTHARGGTFATPAAIEFIDRTVTLDELYGYEFNKDLVVLSACETGVGKAIKGEGVQNMARAFQYTGTDHVLFSLWNVNDYSTSQIMKNFYKGFGKRGMKGKSLQRAQLEYLSDTHLDNPRKSPYYWAAFVYYGTAETPQNDFNWAFVYTSFALLLLGVLFYMNKRRKASFAKGKPS